jgi:hypothetical protein
MPLTGVRSSFRYDGITGRISGQNYPGPSLNRRRPFSASRILVRTRTAPYDGFGTKPIIVEFRTRPPSDRQFRFRMSGGEQSDRMPVVNHNAGVWSYSVSTGVNVERDRIIRP